MRNERPDNLQTASRLFLSSHLLSHLPSPKMATTRSPETNFNTVTSWLPLTTTFPYQSGCSSAIWARLGFVQSETFDAVAFDPGYGITVDPAVTCMPSQVTLWWETETAPVLNGLTTRYSVGPIVCPGGFTTAGTSVVNEQSTQVACCPSWVALLFYLLSQLH